MFTCKDLVEENKGMERVLYFRDVYAEYRVEQRNVGRMSFEIKGSLLFVIDLSSSILDAYVDTLPTNVLPAGET